MEPKPVTRNLVPRYPTRLEVLENRELLEKHMPATWKSCVEMAGAATILLAVNSCLAQQSPIKANHARAIVAPIFEHGEGRAAAGCEVVNPPVFLSEQDAMQVIGEELEKSGLMLTDRKVRLPDVSIPQNLEEWSNKKGKIERKPIATGNPKQLVLQGFDPRKRVGIAVVQSDDYFDLGGAQSSSTVQGFDFKKVAKEVRDRVAADGHDLYLGTFYDPGAAQQRSSREDDSFYNNVSKLYKELENTTDSRLKKQKEGEIQAVMDKHHDPLKQESRRLLRLQVKDFIEWLKGQGVI
jgi:hypothetical protein